MSRGNKKYNTYDVIMTGDMALTSNDDFKTVRFSSLVNREDYTKVQHGGYGGVGEIAFWGSDNQLPQRREALVKDNNIVPELIKTKRDLILGSGLYFYNEIMENGQEREERIDAPNQILDWLEMNEWDDYAECSAGEYVKHGNTMTEFIANRAHTGIARMHNKGCKYIRAQKQNAQGLIGNYFYHGSWGKVTTDIPQRIPTYNRFLTDRVQTKSIFHTGDKLFHDGYYFYPTYWGGKQWIKTSNNIPIFHQHNLENGYNIRYHIKMPYDYHLDRAKYNEGDDKVKEQCIKDAKTADQAFIDKMNKFLAGMKNSGRAVFTKFKHNMEKAYPGIVIEPIQADLKDEALLKLFDKSNDANISAQGIHPTLASIQTQGKLSSGSDIRNSLLLFLATKVANPRRLLLRPLKIVQKVNGWDPTIKFGFKDKLITKLDDNPNGMQKANPNNVSQN